MRFSAYTDMGAGRKISVTWPTSTQCRRSSPIRFKCPFSQAVSPITPCVRKLRPFLISRQKSPLRGTLVSDPTEGYPFAPCVSHALPPQPVWR
jgi:hypothetical protein